MFRDSFRAMCRCMGGSRVSENWMLKYPTSLALQMLTVTVEIVFHDSYLNRAKPSERPEGIRKGMEFKKH